MKKTIKVILGLCLVLALWAGMGSGVAAATAESVWVNGIELTDGDYLAASDSTTVTAGAAEQPGTYVAWYHNGTLTLNNADIYRGNPFTISTKSGNCGICADGDLVINLKGENLVEGSSGDFLAAIAVNGNVTVTSMNEGKLTVYGKKAGIYGNHGDLTISGDAVITANVFGWTSDNYGYAAIYSMDGDVIMRDYVSVETAFGANAAYAEPAAEVCAYNGNVYISGHVSYIVDKTCSPFDGFGIYAGPTASETSGNLVIDDGAYVSFNGDCLGVGAKQSITIGKNSALIIWDALYGIIWSQSISINGGILEIYNPDGNPFLGNPTITLKDSNLVDAEYTDSSNQLLKVEDLSKVAYSAAAGQYVYNNVHDNYIRYLYYRPTFKYDFYSDNGNWSWAAPYNHFVIENGIMGSVYSDFDYFDTNGTVTRGMVVTVMYRLCGSPELTQADYDAYNNKFTDVASGQWYYDAVVWAYNNGVTDGKTDTTFAPNEKTSREQIITFFWRFCDDLGYDNSGDDVLGGYSDLNKVSNYAVEAMKWSVTNGIVNGTSDTTLSPQNPCTRGQMAKIIYGFAWSYMGDQEWIDIGNL